MTSSWRARDALRAIPFPKHILPTSGSLVGTMIVTGGFGFIYWLIAAKYFSPESVGLAGGAVAAMILLAIFGMLGLGTLLVRESPHYPQRQAGLIATGVAAAAIVGAMLGLGFALLAPVLSDSFRELSASVPAVLLFVVGVSLTTAVLVLDQCLVGALRGDLQLIRNLTFALAKLIALVIVGQFIGGGGLAVVATWVIGDAVSVLLLAAHWARRIPVKRALPREWGLLRRLMPHALGHHMMNVGLLAPSWALPVIVTATLSAERNAGFFVAQLVTGPGLYIPGALAFSLFAVAARSPEQLHHKVRMTLALSLVAAVAAAIGVFVFGRLILGLFGPSYVEDGSIALIALTLTMFPLTVKVHFANLRRLQGRLLGGSAIIVGGAILELVMPAVGAIVWGIAGVSIGVLVAMTLQALVMLPTVVRAARDDDATLRDLKGAASHPNTESV